jgi:hypothetical protein
LRSNTDASELKRPVGERPPYGQKTQTSASTRNGIEAFFFARAMAAASAAEAKKKKQNPRGLAVHNWIGAPPMPWSALLPFILLALIGIIAFYAVYRAGA